MKLLHCVLTCASYRRQTLEVRFKKQGIREDYTQSRWQMKIEQPESSGLVWFFSAQSLCSQRLSGELAPDRLNAETPSTLRTRRELKSRQHPEQPGSGGPNQKQMFFAPHISLGAFA
jgi:hypothetical protein